jgi:hypothetical protein
MELRGERKLVGQASQRTRRKRRQTSWKRQVGPENVQLFNDAWLWVRWKNLGVWKKKM